MIQVHTYTCTYLYTFSCKGTTDLYRLTILVLQIFIFNCTGTHLQIHILNQAGTRLNKNYSLTTRSTNTTTSIDRCTVLTMQVHTFVFFSGVIQQNILTLRYYGCMVTTELQQEWSRHVADAVQHLCQWIEILYYLWFRAELLEQHAEMHYSFSIKSDSPAIGVLISQK